MPRVVRPLVKASCFALHAATQPLPALLLDDVRAHALGYAGMQGFLATLHATDRAAASLLQLAKLGVDPAGDALRRHQGLANRLRVERHGLLP